MGQIIIIPDLCTEGNYNTMADVCLSVRLSVACLELTRANSEAIRPYGAILELGRYRYLESVSVFGIFVGIFSCLFGIRYRYFKIPRYSVSVGISEILVENRKFLVPNLYLAPLLRVTPSEL